MNHRVMTHNVGQLFPDKIFPRHFPHFKFSLTALKFSDISTFFRQVVIHNATSFELVGSFGSSTMPRIFHDRREWFKCCRIDEHTAKQTHRQTYY